MEKRILLERRGRPTSEMKELILDNSRSIRIEGFEKQDWTNLETLSLINVGLTTLTGFPSFPNLKQLELSDNRISSGLECLKGCPLLRNLNLGGNKIKDIEVLEPLKDFAELRSLDLFNCEITNVDSYREKVFAMFPQLTYLDGFDRNDEEADDEDEDSAGEEADDDDEDEEEYDEVEEDEETRGIKELVILNCKEVDKDRFKNCDLSSYKMLSFVNAAISSLEGFPAFPNLTHLDLSDNQISSGLEALKLCPALTNLNLAGNNFDSFDCLEPLKDLENLHSLYFFNCKAFTADDSTDRIFEMLPQLTFLNGFLHNQEEDDDDPYDDDDLEQDEVEGEEYREESSRQTEEEYEDGVRLNSYRDAEESTEADERFQDDLDDEFSRGLSNGEAEVWDGDSLDGPRGVKRKLGDEDVL